MLFSSRLWIAVVLCLLVGKTDAIGGNIFRQNANESTTAAKDNETLAQALAWTDTFTNGWEWEWTLIRINGLGGLENADFFSAADTQISVKALNATEPPVHFHGEELVSQFYFDVQKSNDEPIWYEIGMVAYEKDTVSEIEIAVTEVDFGIGANDELIKVQIDLPPVYDTWEDYTFNINDYSLNVSLWRGITPIFTEADQRNMNLTEVLFDLEDGSVASLVHYTDPSNDKAVLYIAGRADSFAHPHVLQMYTDLGYDFYSLDPRYCGRTRRFLNDTTYKYGHSIDSFDTYAEEMNLTMDFIHNTNNYTNLVVHCHSTGALVALHYAMMLEEDPFDGYVLNGPFLDWGQISYMEEFLLENAAGMLDSIGMENAISASGLGLFHAKTWILNRYNTTLRPIIQLHLTMEWAQAASTVQEAILARPLDNPVTDKPVLLIASLADNTLDTDESQERMPHIASNYSEIILTHNSHDVTYSVTRELDDDAIRAIASWLESNIEASNGTAVVNEATTAPTSGGGDISGPIVEPPPATNETMAPAGSEGGSTPSPVETDSPPATSVPAPPSTAPTAPASSGVIIRPSLVCGVGLLMTLRYLV